MQDICVVGTGMMGKNHARIVHSLGRLSCIVDSNSECANEIANKYGVKAYNSCEDMLMNECIKGVIIAVPTTYHHGLIHTFMNADIPILVEKPMCKDISESASVCRRASRENKLVAVGHIERYNPVVAFLKEAVQSGSFGHLNAASASRLSVRPTRITDVGVTHDISVHDIDALRYILGAEIASVISHCQTRNNGIDYHNNSILKFENGVVCTIETSWLSPIKKRELTLMFEKAIVYADYIEQAIMYGGDEPLLMERREPLLLEILDFLDAVDNEHQPTCTCMDGFINVCIAESMLKSSHEGREIDVRKYTNLNSLDV